MVVLGASPLALIVPVPERPPMQRITMPPPAVPLLAKPRLGVPVPPSVLPAPPPPPITRREALVCAKIAPPIPPQGRLEFQLLPPPPPKPPLLPPPPPELLLLVV